MSSLPHTESSPFGSMRAGGTAETRKDAADTLSVASNAVKPNKAGIGQKIALAGTVLRLARRYPVPAVIVGGIALAYYLSRGNGRRYVD